MLPLLLLACTAPDGDSGKGTDATADTGDTGDSGVTQDTSGTGDSTDTSTTPQAQGLVVRTGAATANTEGYEGWEELAFIGDEGDGDDLCRVRYQLSSIGARTDCADCTWAHDLGLAEITMVTETTCPAGFPPPESTTRSYGYIAEYFGHANVLAEDAGAGWSATSFADWDETSGAFDYEIEDGLQPI